MSADKLFWKSIITWSVRILTGFLFIFSGFVKAIDPWGTILKVFEYLGVLGFQVWPSIVTVGVFGLCAIEFVVGVFLLTGCFRKSCPIVAALIMCFMLPLSLWVAISDPVPDCGCFGDALVISNTATFIKNIILSAGICWLIIYNTKAVCLISPAFQWLSVVASGLFVIIIESLGYFYQPLIDFRPYPIGTKVFAAGPDNDDGEQYTFVYEKDGQEHEFGINDTLPSESEGWIFKGRRVKPGSGKAPSSEDKGGLHLFDLDDYEDVTEEVADGQNPLLLVMIPNVSRVSPATTWKLNSLYEWSAENSVGMVGVVAGNKDEIEKWEDLSMAEYPLYLADDTSIREVVRGNPGIVYLKDGKVVWKTSLSAIDIDDFLSPDVANNAEEFGIDSGRLLFDLAIIYLIIEAFLIFISFTPRLDSLMMKGGLASKKGVRHH